MEGADRRDGRAFRGTQSALTTFSGVSGIGSIHRVTGRPGFFGIIETPDALIFFVAWLGMMVWSFQ